MIELASAGVLLWPLAVEVYRSAGFFESLDGGHAGSGSTSLFALAVYVMVNAAYGFWVHHGQGFFNPRPLSLPLAILVSWWLAKGKRRIADEIGSLSSPESPELVKVDGGPVFA